MKSFLVAVSFLTRVPLGRVDRPGRALSRSVVWYPVVGLGVAGGCVLVHGLMLWIWPTLTANLLGLVLLVVLKDAFHLDGLADFTDGVVGGETPGARYRIMGDPSLGVMGGLAVLGVTAVEAVVLLPAPAAVFRRALLLVVPLSSAAAGLLLCLGPVRSGTGGLGERLGRGRNRVDLAVLLAGSVLLALAVSPRYGFLLWGGMALAVPVFGAVSRRVTDGVTGDGCGALTMLVQAGLLLLLQAAGVPGEVWPW